MTELTKDEEAVLTLIKTTKPKDKRGWTYTTINHPDSVVDSLVSKGLLWKSGPRQLGNVRRFRLPEDAE